MNLAIGPPSTSGPFRLDTRRRPSYHPGMDTDGPIFIVGCERSGTTLLGLMLMQSKGLHVVHETRFLTTLRDRAGDYGDFMQPHQRWFFLRDLQHERATANTSAFDPFKLDLVEAEEALRSAAPATFARAAEALFEASAAKAGKKRWGDKTPRYVTAIDWIADVYPDSRFVHVIRDARDTARSLVKAGWQPNIRRAAEHWARQVTTGRRMGVALSNGRYEEIKFEELVEHPEEQLKRITSGLGLEYSPTMLNFFEETERVLPGGHMYLFEEAKGPANAARAYAWRTSMSRADVADIEEVVGTTLEEFGYPLAGHDVSGLRKIERSLIGALKPGLEVLRSHLKDRDSFPDLKDRDRE